MSHKHQSFRLFALAISILLVARTAPAQNDATPLPRYHFQAGQHYLYEIRIEAELPDAMQVLSGHLDYNIKAVDSQNGQMTLISSGSLTNRPQTKGPAPRGMMPRPPRIPRPPMWSNFGGDYNTPREILIDPAGTLVRSGGQAQLPFMLGNVYMLLIDPMPPKAQRAWQVNRDIDIVENDSRFRGFPFSGDNRSSQSAKETTSFTLGQISGDTVKIGRKYKLSTVERTGSQPLLQQSGDGTITFDLTAGVPRALELKQTIKIDEKNANMQVPVTVTARLLDPAEAEKYFKDREANMAAAKRQVEEANKPRELDADAVDACIEGLKARDSFKVSDALKRLALAANPVERKRADVVKAVQPLLDDRDHFVRVSAAKALGVWGTEATVPVLVAALEDEDYFFRKEAMGALARIGDPRGAEALAKRMRDFRDRQSAGQALKDMGGVAEPAVLPLLKNREWAVQLEACKILAVIGTQKSIAPLKTAIATAERIVVPEAEKALKAVQARRSSRPQV